jgi:sialate O-acetylesterase
MKIIGLKDGMVMQRGADDTACISFTSDREVEKVIYVSDGDCCPAVIEPSAIRLTDGMFTYILTGIPAGGPYTLILKAKGEEQRFSEMYTGDVWLLAGQSNMEGVGIMTEDDLVYSRNPEPTVRALYMTDEWGGGQPPGSGPGPRQSHPGRSRIHRSTSRCP